MVERGGYLGGALGGLVGGRMRSPMGYRRRGCRYQNRARKGLADEGPAGLFRGGYYSVDSFGLGVGKGLGSKSSQPTGIVNTQPSATVTCSVSNRVLSADILNSYLSGGI